MKLFFKKIDIARAMPHAMLCGALLLFPYHIETSVEPLKEYLAALKELTQQHDAPQENLATLYTLLEQQELTAITPEIIDAAFTEATTCLEKGASESTAHLVAELETQYDNALAITDTENSPKRAAKTLKKYLNLTVHNQLSAGELFVGGDAHIHRNLIVDGTTTFAGGTIITGNETINGNLDVTGNTTLGTCPTSINTIQGTTNINSACAAPTTIGNSTSTTAINGPTTITSTAGIPLQVTGNATNPAAKITGAGSAGALQLVGNQPSVGTDLLLTIDPITGIVHQGPGSAAGAIVNGGQPGPLVIGTNDATSMTFITNNANRIAIDSSGAVTIQQPAAGVALTIVGGGADVTGTTNINTTGVATTTVGNCVTPSTNNLAGITNINTTCGTPTNIGNNTSPSTTTITGPTDINTGLSSATTTIGNSGGPSTNTILGVTNINTTGTQTTNIGNGASVVNVVATTNVTGPLNVNLSGNATTRIGNPLTNTFIDGMVDINTAPSAGATNIGNNSNTTTITGPTTMTSSSGIPLSVTGNATNTAILAIGNNTTVAPALRLTNNPAGAPTDFHLSIDALGNVTTQFTVPIGKQIVNGGQPGPLTIGTTDATTMSFITNDLQRILINQNGGVTIQTPAGGEQGLTIAGGGETITAGGLTVVAGGAGITGTTNINTSGAATTTIGNCAATNDIAGTTTINTACATPTNIGNATSVTTVNGPTNINTTGTATTTIGNNAGPSTTAINGATTIAATAGIPLSVTGNASNPTIVSTGSSTTTAPALQLINNPAGVDTDFFLTIDSTGVVKQSTSTIATGFIVNGGQPGPLTIGTTDATSMNFITNNTTRLGIDQNGNITMPGFVTVGSLDVLGTATINGLLYQLANTVSPNNILYVQKGPITAPNQFNSVKTALDSIAGNSATNPFAINVGPGIFVEDAMVMKPWVVITGEDQDASFILTNTGNPANTSIFAGAANSTLSYVTLQGSTTPGFSALIYTDSTGEFGVDNVTFIGNSSALNMFGNAAVIHMRNIEIADQNGTGFSTTNGVFNVDGSTPTATPRFLTIQNLKWLPSNPIASNYDFIKLIGPSAAMTLSGVTAGSNVLLGGNFINNQNAAQMTLSNANIAGFARAIYIPNIIPPFPGFGPLIAISATATGFNTIDLEIDQPFTSGSVQGSFDTINGKVIIDPAITNLSVLIQEPANGGITALGPLFTATTINTITNISPEISYESDIGVIEGGLISGNNPLQAGTVTGLSPSFTVTAAAGNGYLMVGVSPNDNLRFTQWPQQAIVLTATNADYYLYIDQAGTLQTSFAETSIEQTIQLGKVRTGSSGVLFIQQQDKDARHMATKIEEMLEQVFGPIYVNGSVVTQTGALQLNVSQGQYYFGNHQYTPAGGSAITWEAFLGGSTNAFLTNQSSVDYQNYDGGNGSLVPIPLGDFARHELYVIGDGSTETYALVYSQTVYTTLNNAIIGANPAPPATWNGNIAPLAAIIVTNTTTPANGIQQIIDQRPRPAFVAGTVSLASNNVNTLQFLTLDGTRVMAGHLQMGNNNITNAANITGNGLLTIGGGAGITGATNINISGAATTSIGTGGGTTNIGSSGTVNIGATTGTVDILGTVGINTSGSATTTIGNNAGPSTTSIRGATTINATAGIPLNVTGNASNPTIVSTGSSTTTAPALTLVNNPTAFAGNLFLQIDAASGAVTQGTASSTGFIINGGQPGPLTIGTTNATTMSFITDNIERQLLDQNGSTTFFAPTAGTNPTVTIQGDASHGALTTTGGTVLIGAPTTGVALTVTGNTSNSAILAIGNGSTTAAALQLIGNPTAASGDFILTIDPVTGVVKQGTSPFGNEILNGGQPGPLTIGTTNATSMNFVTNGATNTRLAIDSNGEVTIGAPTAGTALTVNGLSGQNALATTVSTVLIGQPAAGIALTVTGNTSNAALLVVGNGTTIAPALQLFGNPTSTILDHVLTIDPVTGVVKEGVASAAGFIVNGCQPGPLTIGTTNGTSFSLNTGSAGICNQRIVIDANGGVTIQTPSSGTALTIVGGGESVTGTTNINTTGVATTSIGISAGATTDIGTSGGNTNIGNCSSTNTIAGTTNINTACSTQTTIGNATSTTVITGTTNINATGFFATNIGTSGAPTNIGSGASTNTIQGQTIVTGSTNINTTGMFPTNIGNNLSTTHIIGQVLINDVPGNLTTIGTGGSPVTINGATVITVTSGVPLTVNGNASNPAIVANGNGTTTAPALKLVNNPTSLSTDFLLTIDGFGVVKQGTSLSPVGNFIINGGQPGPLTIGTTNATSMNFITSNVTRIALDQLGDIVITGTTAINTTGFATTTIGNCPNTTTNISGTTNINTSGTCTTNIGTAGGATNIGSSVSSNTMQGTNRFIGNNFMSAASGVVLTVTGNATNPSTVLVGNSSTTAPALKLINNPTGVNTDFLLTIDSTGVVKQTGSSIQSGFIINGGQPGPLTIATTNSSTLTLGGCNGTTIDIEGTTKINTTCAAATTIGNSASTITTNTNVTVNGRIFTQAGSVGAPAYSFIGNTQDGMYAPATNQLALVASGTARVLIDSTQSVTIFSKYKVHAYLAATQSVTGTATIAFDTETFDPNNNFTTGAGANYTAPVTGYYLATVNVGFVAGNNNVNHTVAFTVNNVAIPGYQATTSGANAAAGRIFLVGASVILNLNGGDVVRASYTAAAGTDVLQPNDTHIDIHYLSF